LEHNEQLARLLALSRSFMEARIFLTAVELRMFQAIGGGRPTAEELAGQTGADPRAAAVLLDALVALGLLAKEGERFANAPALAGFLAPDGPAEGTGFELAVQAWDAWSRLSDVVRSGAPPRRPEGEAAARMSAAAMDLYSQVHAGPLVRMLDCSGVTRLLDLGGGTGTYALEMAKRHPQLCAAIFDANEAALEIARERIAAYGLGDRVSVHHGDFLRDDLGDGYDMVLLSSVICLLAEEENLALLGRVREAMNVGAQLVISDVMADDAGTGPPAAAVFGVHLLVTSPTGRVYPHARVARWLHDAGLSGVCRIPLGSGCILIARRAT